MIRGLERVLRGLEMMVGDDGWRRWLGCLRR